MLIVAPSFSPCVLLRYSLLPDPIFHGGAHLGDCDLHQFIVASVDNFAHGEESLIVSRSDWVP